MYARLGNIHIYIYISKCRFLFARVDIRFVTRRNSERGGGGVARMRILIMENVLSLFQMT